MSKAPSLVTVRKLNLSPSEQLDRLARAAGDLYSRVVVTYWRLVRKKGVFLSQYGMERIHISPELHAHTSDAIVGNFYASVKSAKKRKEQGDTEAKYPYRRKWFYKITWKASAIRVKDGLLLLSNGKGNPKLAIPWRFATPKQVEIGWKKTGGYELRATYGVAVPEPIATGGVAAIDQGEIRTATVHDGEHNASYNGRLVRSKNRYRAKTVAALDAAISKTTKGSRRREKLIQAKRRALAKVEGQIRDILHKQSSHLVSTLFERGVQTVVIGDLRDIRKDLNYGKKTNQKLHGWSFGAFRQMVTYKAQRLGMQVVMQEESYTSQTCPCCGAQHKPKGREYRCNCGFALDRDVVGAINIRRKYLGCFDTPVVGVYGSPLGIRYRPDMPCRSALPRTPCL